MLERDQQIGYFALVSQFLDHARRHLVACFADHFACRRINQVHGRTGAAHAFREELGDPALALLQVECDRVVIGRHDRVLIHAQRIKQRGHRQFAATVDPREHHVFGVEFEIQPRPAIRNDPALEQQLARAVRLALIMVEEHAGRAVHLADHNAFRAVHNERTVIGHERHVAHEYVLFLDIFDRARAGIFVHIEHDQTQRDL